jgi:hypothetical protein
MYIIRYIVNYIYRYIYCQFLHRHSLPLVYNSGRCSTVPTIVIPISYALFG